VVFIGGTTNYDGAWNVSSVSGDTYRIDCDYVADDATGTGKRAVNVTRSALTTDLDGCYPLFGATTRANAPLVNPIFNMDSTGSSTSRNGIYAGRGGFVRFADWAGVLNAGNIAVLCRYDGLVVCVDCFFRGANFGAYCQFGGRIVAHGCDFSGASSNGCYCDYMGMVSVETGNLSGCGSRGIYAARGGFVSAYSVDVSDSMSYGIEINLGGIVTAQGATATGCGDGAYSHTLNTATNDGIIYG